MFRNGTPRSPERIALSWLGLALAVAVGGCMLTGSDNGLTAGPAGLAAAIVELQCYPDTVTAPGGTTAVVPIVLSYVDVPAAAADNPALRHGGDGHSHDSHDGHSHGDHGSSSDDSSSDDSSSDDSSSDDSSSSSSSDDSSSSSSSSSDDSSSDDGNGVDCSRVCHCAITENSPMEAFLVDIEFDQTYLTYNGTLAGNATSGWVYFDGKLLAPGVVRIGGFTSPASAVANPDTLGYVVFNVAPAATGYSYLETTNFQDDLAGLPNAEGCIRH